MLRWMLVLAKVHGKLLIACLLAGMYRPRHFAEAVVVFDRVCGGGRVP